MRIISESDTAQRRTHETSGAIGLRVGGIDLGKRRIAIATFEVNDGEIDLIDLTDVGMRVGIRTRGRELGVLADTILGISLEYDWHEAFVEEPLMGMSVASSMSLAESAGVAQFALGDVNTTMVNVRTWKHVVLGNGNASKGQIRTYVDQNHPLYASWCDSQDAYDAVCIGYYGALRFTPLVDGAGTRAGSG